MARVPSAAPASPRWPVLLSEGTAQSPGGPADRPEPCADRPAAPSHRRAVTRGSTSAPCFFLPQAAVTHIYLQDTLVSRPCLHLPAGGLDRSVSPGSSEAFCSGPHLPRTPGSLGACVGFPCRAETTLGLLSQTCFRLSYRRLWQTRTRGQIRPTPESLSKAAGFPAPVRPAVSFPQGIDEKTKGANALPVPKGSLTSVCTPARLRRGPQPSVCPSPARAVFSCGPWMDGRWMDEVGGGVDGRTRVGG